MNFKKVILVTMGVAMSVCAANAQSWKYSSNGIYSYPVSEAAGNLALGISPSSTTSSYKLYVNGTSKFTNYIYAAGGFAATGTDNRIENGLSIYGTNQMSRTNLWIRKTDNTSLNGMRVSACGYNNFTDLTFDATKFYFNGAYGAKFMEMDSKVKVLTDFEVAGKIKCKSELEVAEVLKANQIKAQDINVEMNNAADYVFEDSYELKSLSEVENYVKANKHLPGVPTAAEMAENGMSMAQMSNLLLEKVEELTLHMIELQKENQALKAKVESMEK